MAVVGVWDATKWDQSQWYVPTPPATAGWGDDWRWWYQVGAAVVELAGMVVEARWTTDSFTMADGTFRGDLQPGKLTVRLWDPARTLDGLSLMGLIYAHYRPAGLVFVWFADSITRGLYGPGDPAAADVVITGLGWPARLTTVTSGLNRPDESAAARLAAVVAAINAQQSTMVLPPMTGDIAGQSQPVGATVVDSSGFYPSCFQSIRDASVFGVSWLEGTGGAKDGTVGALMLRYRRWETTRLRPLDPSQVVAGPPSSRALDWAITQVEMQPLDHTVPGGGSLYPIYGGSSAMTRYGLIRAGPCRVWDLLNGSGPAYQPILTTFNQILADHSQDDTPYLSSVSLQSGPRWTSDGRPSTAHWDPTAHVFSPTDVADYVDPGSGAHQPYRVVQSDHVLNASVWQTTHTLEWCTYASPLPA